MNKIRMIVEGDAYEQFSQFLELGLKANELGFKFKVYREGEEAILKQDPSRIGYVSELMSDIKPSSKPDTANPYATEVNATRYILKLKDWVEDSERMFTKIFQDKNGLNHTYKLPLMDAYARQFVEDQK